MDGIINKEKMCTKFRDINNFQISNKNLESF